MEPTSTEQQRREAAEKRREFLSREQARFAETHPATVTEERARRTHPLVAESRNGGVEQARPIHHRSLAFPTEFRTETVERDGKNFFRTDGYATTFDREYEMWDIFGPYNEEVVSGAADVTLAAKPDVVFLINHRGLSLARTGGPWNNNNGTLELSADATGLRNIAWLNPERSEVKDLMLGIDDKIITEQSFAFQIDEGLWNEDFTKFQIVRFDINRGDVSAVNYGANPYTSIAARQQEILTDLRLAGPAMARAALHSLLQRTDLVIDHEVDRIDEQRRTHQAKVDAEAAGKGRSLAQIEALLATSEL